MIYIYIYIYSITYEIKRGEQESGRSRDYIICYSKQKKHNFPGLLSICGFKRSVIVHQWFTRETPHKTTWAFGIIQGKGPNHV